jgi:hypothetical protein
MAAGSPQPGSGIERGGVHEVDCGDGDAHQRLARGRDRIGQFDQPHLFRAAILSDAELLH